MTHKDRMLAAIRHEPVDCVPHCPYNCHPYSEFLFHEDPSYTEILEHIRATAGIMVKVATGRSNAISPDRYHERRQELGDVSICTTTLTTPKGDLTRETQSVRGQPPLITRHFINSDDDIEKYMSLPYEPSPVDVTPVCEAYKSCGEQGLVFVCYGEPMYSAAQLFHFQDFCMRCMTDLPSIKRMVDWHLERNLDHVRRLISACKGMDVILHTSGPEVCTPPMMSPAIFAHLVTPYMKRIVDTIHDGGMLAAIHCHGRVREVLPEILKTGCDLLDPIEPPDQGNITLDELMTQCEKRMALLGYIQDQEFYTAVPGQMTNRVEEIARIVEGRTGYIMSTSCTPFDHPCTDTYRRNFLEWLDAADRVLAQGGRN